MKELFIEVIKAGDKPISGKDLAAALSTDICMITNLADDLGKHGRIRLVFHENEFHYYPTNRPVWYVTDLDRMMHNLLKENGTIDI